MSGRVGPVSGGNDDSGLSAATPAGRHGGLRGGPVSAPAELDGGMRVNTMSQPSACAPRNQTTTTSVPLLASAGCASLMKLNVFAAVPAGGAEPVISVSVR